MDDSQAIQQLLRALFDAEREVRRLHDGLVSQRGSTDAGVFVAELTAAIERARTQPREEAALRLVCIARLLGEFEGAEIVDGLVEVLATEHPEARNEAGDQLQGLAFDNFPQVAEGFERAMERLPVGSPALKELPYLLAEIPEPGAMVLLERLLGHADPDVVGGAIEVLVEVGDPAAARLLAPLRDDDRTTGVGEELRPGQGRVTIGELAVEAVALLQQTAAPPDDDGSTGG